MPEEDGAFEPFVMRDGFELPRPYVGLCESADRDPDPATLEIHAIEEQGEDGGSGVDCRHTWVLFLQKD